MNINIICVGKIKEKYLKDAIAEYSKRISRFAKLEITEGLSGPLIINNDNDIIHDNLDYIKSLCNTITIGIDNDSDYKAYDIEENPQ